jgi:aspartyl aminopeptidase
MADVNTFFDFLRNSPSSFHAAAESGRIIAKAGGEELFSEHKWSLEAGKLYFIRKRGFFAAFRAGTEEPARAGFSIVAAHTDSPGLKLKYGAGKASGPFLRVPVEVYGGAIISSWLDRDLSCSGIVVSENRDYLVSSGEAVAIIPNLAIHMNKNINEGYAYNRQEELQALFPGSRSLDDILHSFPCTQAPGNPGLPGASPHSLGKALSGSEEGVDSILSADLFLHDSAAPAMIGDCMAAGRIDNLASCHAALGSLIHAPELKPETRVVMFSDAEEVGSSIESGAASILPLSLLRRIVAISGGEEEAMQQALARSFLISADGAHAVHPNFSSKHDPDYAPVLGGGPVLKMNAAYAYATSAESGGRFISLCKSCNVPFQRLIGRSDMKSGSTVGAILSAGLGVSAVDVGIPMLAMHSVRETASPADLEALSTVLTRFFT